MTDYYIMTSGNRQNIVSEISDTSSPIDEVSMDFSTTSSGYYFPTHPPPLHLAGGSTALPYPYYPQAGYIAHYGDATPVNVSYSGSSSSDEQPFISSHEVFTASSSPTSIMSSQSLQSYQANHFPDSRREGSYFELTAPIGQLNISTFGGYRSSLSDDSYDQQSNGFSYMPVGPNSEHSEDDRNFAPVIGQSNSHSISTSNYGFKNAEDTPIKQESTPALKKANYKKKQPHQKKKKRCFNCHSTNAPSWRRSISEKSKGSLLCNACGLYEKTQGTNRKLVTHPDGLTKVVRKRDAPNYCCSQCGNREATKWRKSNDSLLICEICLRGRRKASL
ncbi:hypothetical protein BDF20DRAFT_848950 [Mycotypha africana]|uniref:uncharacterized protein n=1 Tax=Mycotypha africana TaxID=64632 RepID=UPI0023005AE4|nr:uncharacterized protein BDF20DRAFT_848950 [Mycotypha africana]KAI8987231.1 hypothetical protein BDF20DRAFT_848950 [Mycotypha africana]